MAGLSTSIIFETQGYCLPSSSEQTARIRVRLLVIFSSQLTLNSVTGPSYKRGPPKGYINAIEQRLHQVEAVLCAIIHSKDARSRGIISDLKTDTIAREIINRVDNGPYGSAARSEASGSKPADFSATIRKLKESQESRRDSRVKRENVSSSLGTRFSSFVIPFLTELIDDIPTPTPGWLKQLEDILEGNLRLPGQFESSVATNGCALISTYSQSALSEKVDSFPKLDITSAVSASKDEPYSARTSTGSEFADSEEDVIERIEEEEAIGRLSVDEHNEVRM